MKKALLLYTFLVCSVLGCDDARKPIVKNTEKNEQKPLIKNNFGSWSVSQRKDEWGDDTNEYTIRNKVKGKVYNTGDTYKTNVDVLIYSNHSGLSRIGLRFENYVRMVDETKERLVKLKDYEQKTEQIIYGKGIDNLFAFEDTDAEIILNKLRSDRKVEIIFDVNHKPEKRHFVSIVLNNPLYAEAEKSILPFIATTDKFIHNAEIIKDPNEKLRDSYPLKRCVVSGETLGSMGTPVIVKCKGTIIKLCCKHCIPDVERNQEKFAKIIQNAR